MVRRPDQHIGAERDRNRIYQELHRVHAGRLVRVRAQRRRTRGTAAVRRPAVQLADDPRWPESGVVFWGPLTLPAQIAMPGDIIVMTYDATGHVLREVPLIFLG